MNRALTRGGTAGLIGLGLTNGLLPCGLVYSALLIAASSGGLLSGGLGMFLFGMSTTPALLVVGMGAGKAFYIHSNTFYRGKTSILKMGRLYYELKVGFKSTYFAMGGKIPHWQWVFGTALGDRQ